MEELNDPIYELHKLKEVLETDGWAKIIAPYIEHQSRRYQLEIFKQKGEDRIESVGMLKSLMAFEKFIESKMEMGRKRLSETISQEQGI